MSKYVTEGWTSGSDKDFFGSQMTAKPPEYKIPGSAIKHSQDLGHEEFHEPDLIIWEKPTENKSKKIVQIFIMATLSRLIK